MHARSTRTLADVRDSFIETEGVSLPQMAPWVVLCKYPPRLPVPCTVFSIRKNFYSSKKRKNFLFFEKERRRDCERNIEKILLHYFFARFGKSMRNYFLFFFIQIIRLFLSI